MDETVKALHTPDSQPGILPLLEKIAANLPGMFFQFLQQQDGSQSLLYVSSGCQDLYELEPEVVQRDFQILSQLIHPQDIKTFEESVATSCAQIESWRWEGRIITPSGKLKWIQGTACPERQGSDVIWVGLFTDITDRKIADEKLRESEARYKAILDAIPDLMFRMSRNGEYLDFKGEGANLDIPKNEIVGKNLRDVLPPDVALTNLEAIAKTLDSRTLQICEYLLPTHEGMRDYESRLVVSGQDEVLAIVRDITERKQVQLALREYGEKFSKAFHSSPIPITILTFKDGRYVDVNDAFVQISGFSREEVIGRSPSELNLWRNSSLGARMHKMLQDEGFIRHLETEFYTKSGDPRVVLFSAEIIHIGGEPCVLCVINDITQRQQAEELLRLSANRDRLLAETLKRIRHSLNLDQILHTTVNEVRQFLQADRVFIALRDVNTQSRILAESVDPLYPSVLNWKPEHEAYVLELKKLLTTNCVRVVEDITQIAASPQLTALYQQFHTRATLAVPIILNEELFGAVIANQCYESRHWQPMEIDLLQQMSEQVAIAIQQAQLYQELAQLNSNLERQVEERTAQLQQKMQEIQELNRVKDVVLHTVSHDLRTSVMGNLMVLNNLLNQGVGNGKKVEGDEGDEGDEGATSSSSPSSPLPIAPNPQRGPRVPHYPLSPEGAPSSPLPVSRSIIERMIQGNDRQLTMIDSLLAIHASVEQGVVLHREVVNLSTLLSGIIKDLSQVLAQNQAIVNNLVPLDLPLVSADPTQLQKVFVSLFTQGLQNNPPGLNFTLKAKVEKAMIRVYIQDNGVGMSKLECDRLFDLYVRDPQERCSTNIGLKMFLCRQIIQAHGGEMGVISSNRKRGLTFWFTLPLA